MVLATLWAMATKSRVPSGTTAANARAAQPRSAPRRKATGLPPHVQRRRARGLVGHYRLQPCEAWPTQMARARSVRRLSGLRIVQKRSAPRGALSCCHERVGRPGGRADGALLLKPFNRAVREHTDRSRRALAPSAACGRFQGPAAGSYAHEPPLRSPAITEPGGAERLGIAPGILAPITAGRLVAPLKRFRGAIFVRAAGNAGAALEVPSDHRGGSRGRPRHHRSAPRTLDEALRLPGRLRARENGVDWRREGRDRGQKGAAHCGPVPGVDPRGGPTAQGRTPALRKAVQWIIERARTGRVVRGTKVMEQRVSLITLGVKDLDQSRAFYERLGWRRSALNAEGVVFFQVGGLVLSLFPREHLAKDAALSPEGSGFCGIALAYNTRSKQEVDEGDGNDSLHQFTYGRGGGPAAVPGARPG